MQITTSRSSHSTQLPQSTHRPARPAFKAPEWATAATAEGRDPVVAGRAAAWMQSIARVTTLSVGLALGAGQLAQAQNVSIVCDPTIASKAIERHQLRIKLAKEGGTAIDIPALEATMQERVQRLCAMDIETQIDKQAIAADKQAIAADKQAIAADKQAIAADKQATAVILATTMTKEELVTLEKQTAADKQAAANYKEMGEIMVKIEKQTNKPSDIKRLEELYKITSQTASKQEKESALPIIASILRKFGVGV